MTGQTLDSRFELALEERHNDGFVELFVLVPGKFSGFEVVQVIVIFLFVPFPIVRLKR